MQPYILSPILPSNNSWSTQEDTESDAFGLCKFKQQVIFVLRQKVIPLLIGVADIIVDSMVDFGPFAIPYSKCCNVFIF